MVTAVWTALALRNLAVARSSRSSHDAPRTSQHVGVGDRCRPSPFSRVLRALVRCFLRVVRVEHGRKGTVFHTPSGGYNYLAKQARAPRMLERGEVPKRHIVQYHKAHCNRAPPGPTSAVAAAMPGPWAFLAHGAAVVGGLGGVGFVGVVCGLGGVGTLGSLGAACSLKVSVTSGARLRSSRSRADCCSPEVPLVHTASLPALHTPPHTSSGSSSCSPSIARHRLSQAASTSSSVPVTVHLPPLGQRSQLGARSLRKRYTEESCRSDGLGSFDHCAQKSSTAAMLGSLVKVSSQFFERALERASGS